MKGGRNRRQKSRRKIAVEKVKFKFTGDACIFKFNLKEGKIVSSQSPEGKVVLMKKDHLHRLDVGEEYEAFGRITVYSEKKYDIFTPTNLVIIN